MEHEAFPLDLSFFMPVNVVPLREQATVSQIRCGQPTSHQQPSIPFSFALVCLLLRVYGT